MKQRNRIPDSPDLSVGEKSCIAVVLVFSCLATGALALWLGLQEDYRTLSQRTLSIQRELVVRIASADTVLTALAGMHRASDEGRPYERLDLSRELLSAYQFITAISEAELIRPDERAGWLDRLRRDGFPTVRISKLDESGRLVDAEAIKTSFPIRFMEPLEPQFARLIGFDIATHPAIAPTLNQVIDTGEVGTSNIFKFIGNDAGWLFLKAIYLGHVDPKSVDERRRQLVGFTILHITVEDLIHDISHIYEDMRVVLMDGEHPAAIDRHENDPKQSLLPTISTTQPLLINGQQYAIHAQLYPAWSRYKLVLISTFMILIAIIGVVLVIAYRNYRVGLWQTAEAERLIRENEQQFRDYAEVASDWYWSMDADLKFDFISDRFQSMTGMDPVKLIGRKRDAIAADDPEMRARIAQNIEDMKARRSFRNFQYRSDRDPKRTSWFSVSGKPIFSDSGEFLGYRGTSRDISAEVNANDEVFRAKESAERANQVKTEFLATMSHELRTPLNAILGFSELMKEELLGPIGTDQYRTYAKDINRSGQHLLDLINDILDISKIDAGKGALDEFDLVTSRVIDAAQSLVKSRAEKGQIAIRIDCADELPMLRADERKLKQILANLLTNAVKFTDPGGIVSVRAWCDPDAGYFLQVSNNGIGIAVEDIDVALTEFGQLDSGIARKYEGTGLGLPLSKALVEQHGGTLDLQSELGIGTTVTIKFPPERIVEADLKSVVTYRYETRKAI